MAKLVLFSGKDCSICEEADKKFKKKFKDELTTGEAAIIVLDDDPDALEWWAENGLPVAPTVVLVSDSQKCLIVLDTDEVLEEEEAMPAIPDAAKATATPPAAVPAKK